MTAKALPPGVVLPPLVTTAAAEPVPTRPAGRNGGRTQGRGSRRHSTRFALLNSFVDVRMRDMPRAAMGVWIALWRDTKPDGTAATGVADLARRAGADRRTILRGLKFLTDTGLVEVVYRGGIGMGCNRYRLRM